MLTADSTNKIQIIPVNSPITNPMILPSLSTKIPAGYCRRTSKTVCTSINLAIKLEGTPNKIINIPFAIDNGIPHEKASRIKAITVSLEIGSLIILLKGISIF